MQSPLGVNIQHSNLKGEQLSANSGVIPFNNCLGILIHNVIFDKKAPLYLL